MSQNNSNTIVAVLAGIALGAAAGILFAPDKGANTRGKIKDDFDKRKKKIIDELEQAQSKFKSRFDSKKHDVEDSYQHLLSDLSHKAEDAITFLEDKLAELKKQNAKYQR